jgi:hypothetical protein
MTIINALDIPLDPLLPPQVGYMHLIIEGSAIVAGCLGSYLNPEGQDVFVCEGWLWLEEGAHAAATCNIGFGATGTDQNQLVSAFPLNGTDNTMWTVVARGASEAAAINAQNGAIWSAGQFLTVTNAAAVSTGLKAHLYLKYIRLG